MNQEDRISSLPTPLIHQIFSFMNMKEVVHTSLLSKQWKTTWASNPYLNISDFYWSYYYPEKYKEFVTSVLSLRDESNIHTFDLKFQISTIDEFLPFLAGKNIQDFRLTYRYVYTTTVFSSALMYITQQVKILVLNSSLLDISLNCPVVETLILENTQYINDDGKFIITAPRLKYMVLSSDYQMKYYYSVVVCAPNLEKLVVKGYLAIDYLLEKTSALTAIEFGPYLQKKYILIRDHDHYREFHYTWDDIARCLSSILNGGADNMKYLTLSANMYQVYLSDLRHQLQAALHECHNLRHLKLTEWNSNDFSSTQALFDLGKQIPCVETLVLEINQLLLLDLNGEECIENLNLSWESTFHFLKFVQIKNAQGSQNELKLLEAMLRGIMVLEEISIKTDPYLFSDKDAKLNEFVSRLQLLRKSSLRVKIYLNGQEILSSASRAHMRKCSLGKA